MGAIHGKWDRMIPVIFLVAAVLHLAGCSFMVFEEPDGPPSGSVDISRIPDAVPRVGPPSRYGNPASYVVQGRRYYVRQSSAGYVGRGVASWYGTKFHGHKTSSGDRYNMYGMTAAHRTLPLPTYVEVTNLQNGRAVVVKVNDRGPFHSDRIIDLSYAAAAKLDILGTGTGLVEVRALDPRRPSAPATPAVHARPRPPPPDLFLQVGAFTQRSNAVNLQRRLQHSLISNINVAQATIDRETVYRVRIGPLANVEEADRLAESLQRYGISNPHIVLD